MSSTENTVTTRGSARKEEKKQRQPAGDAGSARRADPASDGRPPPSAARRCGQVAVYGLLVLLLPGLLNYAALQREQLELRTEGALHDIGQGQKLYLRCEGVGKPTVVLDGPAGRSSDVWLALLPHLSRLTRTCVYDRAGLGFSDRPMESSESSQLALLPAPYTAERAAWDLHRLVAGVSPQPTPLLLVGAELGAAHARVFAHKYPSLVSDLVLVDPLTELLLGADSPWSEFLESALLPPLQTLHVSAAAGVSRLMLMAGLMEPPLQEVAGVMGDVVINRQKHLLCHPRHASTVVDEHFFLNITAAQLNRLPRHPPAQTVTIVTGNYHNEALPPGLNAAWSAAAAALAVRYGARKVTVDGADGSLMYRHPLELMRVLSRAVKARRAELEHAEREARSEAKRRSSESDSRPARTQHT